MAARSQPKGYSGLQILLHWTIAALVVYQVVFGEDIVPAYRAWRRGEEATAADVFNAQIHIYVGIAVLVLAIWRIVLRLRHGAPAAPAGESAIQRWIAFTTHGVLYLVILGMPVSGALAWYLGIGSMGEVHEIGKPVIIIFVALHALGALYQHFFVNSDVLMRMLKPESR